MWVGNAGGDPAGDFMALGEIEGSEVIEGLRVLDRTRYEDGRGFLQKVLSASECGGSLPRGEIYATAAHKGEVKGNHFHLRMGEWFAVVKGEGVLEMCDPRTGKRQSIALGGSQSLVVYVPPGIAHALVNTGEDLLICVAVAETEHDPCDVFAYTVYPLSP